MSKPSVEEVKELPRTPIFAVLDNIRSLHNVGAIFRTAEGVLLDKLYLCGITGTPPRAEITKTALGAEEIVPFEYFEETTEAVKRLKAEGVKVVAVELAEGAKLYTEATYDFPVAFVFGHEVYGVSDEVMALVDEAIYLPMKGRANSLNVAVCFGITIYDAFKKYNEKA